MPTLARRARAVALAALVVLPASACVTTSTRDLELRPVLASGDWEAALGLAGAERRSTDRLLALLEQGHVLHYAGRFPESNDRFQRAEDLADALYTRSLSQAALSLVTNDLTVDYRGKPFELAMVPYYRAFNYVSLGDRGGAAVEARKAALTLARAVQATIAELDEERRTDAARLADNALLHWLSGMLFEWNGELNDAFIAYRNAARAWAATRADLALPVPPWLAGDLGRTARRLGFAPELEALAAEVPELFAERPGEPPGRTGRVVLLVERGWVAHREQVTLNLPILSSDSYRSDEDWAEALALRAGPGWVAPASTRVSYWLTVAVPRMVPPSPRGAAAARLSAGGAGAAETVVADDLDRRAGTSFAAEWPTILVRTIVRGLAKYAATRAAERESDLAGVLVNIFGALTEAADTRGWTTLPAEVSVARLELPPGRWDLTIEYRDRNGGVVDVERLDGVEVTAGGWTFLHRRLF